MSRAKKRKVIHTHTHMCAYKEANWKRICCAQCTTTYVHVAWCTYACSIGTGNLFTENDKKWAYGPNKIQQLARAQLEKYDRLLGRRIDARDSMIREIFRTKGFFASKGIDGSRMTPIVVESLSSLCSEIAASCTMNAVRIFAFKFEEPQREQPKRWTMKKWISSTRRALRIESIQCTQGSTRTRNGKRRKTSKERRANCILNTGSVCVRKKCCKCISQLIITIPKKRCSSMLAKTKWAATMLRNDR